MATKAPTGTEIPRVLIVVVLGLIVIIAIFAIFPFLQQIFSPAAKASLSNIHLESKTGCTGTSTYYTYTWTFTLTNIGNTDENITVAVVPVPPYTAVSPIYTHTYLVPKATSPSETLTYPASDRTCYTDLSSVTTLQVTQTSPP